VEADGRRAADLTNGGTAVLFCRYGVQFWQEDLGLAPGFNVCAAR
jgi:hypothetical protein